MSKINLNIGDVCDFTDTDKKYGYYRFDGEIENCDTVKIVNKTKKGTYEVWNPRTSKKVGGIFKRDLKKVDEGIYGE